MYVCGGGTKVCVEIKVKVEDVLRVLGRLGRKSRREREGPRGLTGSSPLWDGILGPPACFTQGGAYSAPSDCPAGPCHPLRQTP